VAPAEGWVTPAHGNGALRPFRTGEPQTVARGNARLRVLRDVTKAKSPEIAERLIRIALHDSDTRVAVVACQQVLTWAFGKPENLKPEAGEAKPALDVSKLSTNELRVLLKALQAGRVADQLAPAGEAEQGGD